MAKIERYSTSYVMTIDLNDPEYDKKYAHCLGLKRAMTKLSTKIGDNKQFRIEKRGRKPTTGYDRFGNIVGGIKYATVIDVYLYERYPYKYS